MYPELFSVGGITIYTYGVCVAVGFFVAMQYVIKYSINTGITKNQLYDFLFYVIISGIMGARLLYVIINLDYFLSKPLEVVQLWKGGLVYYGGFIGAVVVAFTYLRSKKISMPKIVDVFAPALALGHFFGRIGCFFSGCCYGKECDSFFAIHNKYPTQIFEAFCNLIIFFVLHQVNKKEHKPGLTFLLYLIIYPIIRFIIEFFRGDDRGRFILGLSVGQAISIGIMIISILILIFMYKEKYEKK
ncbi:MAG: prolipoprotein diacylglyceryl transferase [Endomicrobiaceae bacterium]|nr:prolipoprotein diacylglyceryl transferase [Endomicrobiaceae bacterium]